MNDVTNHLENNPQATVPPVTNPPVSSTPVQVEQRVVWYSWKAPQRYFKKVERKPFMILLGIVMPIIILLIILQQYYLIAAILAVLFLVYVLGTYPPPLVTNIITNKGIEAGTEVYGWEVLTNFFFSRREQQILLNIETTLRAPGKIIFLVDEKQMEESYSVLASKLVYKDLRKQARLGTLLDGEWINMLPNNVVTPREGVERVNGQ